MCEIYNIVLGAKFINLEAKNGDLQMSFRFL